MSTETSIINHIRGLCESCQHDALKKEKIPDEDIFSFVASLKLETEIQILIDGEWFHYEFVDEGKNPDEVLESIRTYAPQNKYRLASRLIGDWIETHS